MICTYSVLGKDGCLSDDFLWYVHGGDLTERAQMVDSGRERPPTDEPIPRHVDSHAANPMATSFDSLEKCSVQVIYRKCTKNDPCRSMYMYN